MPITKYTLEDFYKVAYYFYNLKDNKQSNISEKTGCKESYVHKATTRLMDLKINLGALARKTEGSKKFINICIEKNYIKN